MQAQFPDLDRFHGVKKGDAPPLRIAAVAAPTYCFEVLSLVRLRL
jgi:hypothetical protein